MFIDASALTSLLTSESDAQELLARIQHARTRLTSPLALWETSVAVARALNLPIEKTAAAVEDFLALLEIEIAPVPAEAGRMAVMAFQRYGKDRHPAQLNFGDCFAYACARCLGEPLMFKGADFARTDIEAA
jgi:ribonuclease VapC